MGSFLQLATKSILLPNGPYLLILNFRSIIMSSCSGTFKKSQLIQWYQLSYSGHPFDFLSPGTLSNLVPMDYMYQDVKFFLALKYQAVPTFSPKSLFCCHISLSPATHRYACEPWLFTPISTYSLFLEIPVRHPPSARHCTSQGGHRNDRTYMTSGFKNCLV